MPFALRFPTVFSALRAAADAAYWGPCARCDRTTAWYTNVLRGEYRCTACGHRPLSG